VLVGIRRVRNTWQAFALLLLLALIVSRCAWIREALPAYAPPAPPAGVSAAPAEVTPGASAIEIGQLISATVSRNVDGDTLHVRTAAGALEKVRLIGVDTPESTIEHEPFGKEASDYTKSRLPVGTQVWLETDVGLRDRYGRLLAYIWLSPPSDDGVASVRAKMFNAQLLAAGYAQLMTIPPDVKYVGFFTALQAEAREESRGLWGLP
jgi:micrococcal nuclease